ncbi:hypothetical protein [Treponema bryantii]|uniref:hypothetical protein n=1 Tax=Treponema bryantii TaxID=163 RepID=UPI0003B78400|nr:hypothetical protein [Treponema bryantii]
MGLFGIKTKKDREHELNLQREENAAKAREAAEERASQERLAEKAQESQERREQAKIRSAEQEAARNRASQEKIAQTNKEKAIAEAQISAEMDKYAIDKENELKIELAQKQVESEAKALEEETNRLQLEKNASIKQKEIIEKEETTRLQLEKEANIKQTQIEEKAETERVRIKENSDLEAKKNEYIEATRRIQIQEESQIKQTKERSEAEQAVAKEATKQVEINAKRDVEIAEKERQFKVEALTTMKDMFNSYLSVVTETHASEIQALISFNETRKVKFLTSLESARSEKKHLLELSKEAKGQEKLNYLNESRELEKTIRDLQQEDKEADSELMGTLAMLRDKQDKELKDKQSKLTNMDTLFLDFKGEAQ